MYPHVIQPGLVGASREWVEGEEKQEGLDHKGQKREAPGCPPPKPRRTLSRGFLDFHLKSLSGAIHLCARLISDVRSVPTVTLAQLYVSPVPFTLFTPK